MMRTIHHDNEHVNDAGANADAGAVMVVVMMMMDDASEKHTKGMRSSRQIGRLQ